MIVTVRVINRPLGKGSLASTLKGGDSGKPAIVAGKPEESPLYLAVTRTHDDDWKAMPPKEADKLYAEQVTWIKEWIAGGAPWPNEARVQAIAKATRPRGRRRIMSR